MNKSQLAKLYLAALFLHSFLLSAQLSKDPPHIWEKVNPTDKESTRCKDEDLLNFHCGIKDKLLKKYIKYPKNISHTLSLVHSSKEDEIIWENTNKKVSLGNNVYITGKEMKEISRNQVFSHIRGVLILKKIVMTV